MSSTCRPTAGRGHLDNAGSDRFAVQVLETKELGQRIQKTLEWLPSEYRLLLLLVADKELSYEQSAR